MRRFRPLTWLAIEFVKGWRAFISPLYGEVCKYQPSCSAYGLRALQAHGIFRATPMIIWRILRCNPWSYGGYDPVSGTPEARQWRELHPETARSKNEPSHDLTGDDPKDHESALRTIPGHTDPGSTHMGTPSHSRGEN
ncbi:hypothetical protein PH31N_09553 [Cutibacterium modestum 31N]|nr:hypothetical protein [Cutibacterium modestum 31N]